MRDLEPGLELLKPARISKSDGQQGEWKQPTAVASEDSVMPVAGRSLPKGTEAQIRAEVLDYLKSVPTHQLRGISERVYELIVDRVRRERERLGR
ncbi:MAG: hypothetical protein JNK85_06740 [Verrucomicrobiales bacterium]|nr:hypothetical protein [Verrucomicrobiales bacterium]